MREELNEFNPIYVVRSTAESLSQVSTPAASLVDIEAAAGPPRRSLAGEARRNLFILSAVSLLVACLHQWLLGLVEGEQQFWSDWAAALLTFPFNGFQPLAAAVGCTILIVLAVQTKGYRLMTVQQARLATGAAWTCAIGSGALVLFGVLYVAALIVILIVGAALFAFFFWVLISAASGG
jgi:hypothetical protein